VKGAGWGLRLPKTLDSEMMGVEKSVLFKTTDKEIIIGAMWSMEVIQYFCPNCGFHRYVNEKSCRRDYKKSLQIRSWQYCGYIFCASLESLVAGMDVRREEIPGKTREKRLMNDQAIQIIGKLWLEK